MGFHGVALEIAGFQGQRNWPALIPISDGLGNVELRLPCRIFEANLVEVALERISWAAELHPRLDNAAAGDAAVASEAAAGNAVAAVVDTDIEEAVAEADESQLAAAAGVVAVAGLEVE